MDPVYVPSYNEQHEDCFTVIVLVVGCQDITDRKSGWLVPIEWSHLHLGSVANEVEQRHSAAPTRSPVDSPSDLSLHYGHQSM